MRSSTIPGLAFLLVGACAELTTNDASTPFIPNAQSVASPTASASATAGTPSTTASTMPPAESASPTTAAGSPPSDPVGGELDDETQTTAHGGSGGQGGAAEPTEAIAGAAGASTIAGGGAGNSPAVVMGGSGGESMSGNVTAFDDLPAGTEPDVVGRLLAGLFSSQTSDGTKHYKEACAWYGALDVASLLDDPLLVENLTSRYDPYVASYAELLVTEGHVDNNVFGIVPLELAILGAGSAYLTDGVALAVQQQANIDAQIRYAIDDMFMITGLQIQAYRATGERAHLDLAASTMVSYLERLQQPDGTFYHHEDVLIRWGRGNGWVASGLTELLRELEESHDDYSIVRQGYLNMMAGLLDHQIPEGQEGAGLWKQVIDYEGPDNWPETSGSAMFAYAMITGVRSGWLDQGTYGPAARRAWIALVGYLEPSGQLRGVSDWMWDGSVADYVARGRVTGDNHGQAPMLWSAAALLR